MARWTQFVILILLALAATAVPTLADAPIDEARAAIQRHDYAAALERLRTILAKGASDPGRPAAKSLVVKAAVDGSAALDGKGDDEHAVAMLLDAAKLIEPDPRAAELSGRAKRVLRSAYAAAVKQKAYDRALWAVTTAAADFPADKPLANEAAVQALRVQVAAAAIRTQGPAAAYGTVRDLLAAKVPTATLDHDGVDRAAVAIAYAEQLQHDGWYAQAAAVTGQTLAAGPLPAAGETSVKAAQAKALAASARAWLAFGNRSMAAAAVGDLSAAIGSRPADPATAAEAAHLRAALEKLNALPADPAPSIGAPPPPPPAAVPPVAEDVPVKPATPANEVEPLAKPATRPAAGGLGYVPFQNDPGTGTPATRPAPEPAAPTPDAPPPVHTREPAALQPVRLSLAGPAVGEQAWIDGGSGYTLAGAAARVGNSDRNHGGTRVDGQVHVMPGFLLVDGTIDASAGTIHFEGTADRPVVLRRVRIDCEFTASVEARFTVFEDCTFTHAGGWFWNGGHNSKWTMADCVLVGCRFDRLNGFDFGLKLDRCDVVGMTVPPRFWGDQAAAKPSDDAAGFYRGEWSHVVDCDFYDCGFPVSPAWMCVGCNFHQCRATGPATFASRTPLSVDLGVTDDDRPFYDAVVAQTAHSGGGRVTYTREAKGFARPDGPSPLWHLAAAWPPVER